MVFPSFFVRVRAIIMRDRLAEFRGATTGGLIECDHANVVKLAGEQDPSDADECTSHWQKRLRSLLFDYFNDPDLVPQS